MTDLDRFAPQPYPTRDPWEGTDEDRGDDDDPVVGVDCCYHGVGFDEDCYWCDDEMEFIR